MKRQTINFYLRGRIGIGSWFVIQTKEKRNHCRRICAPLSFVDRSGFMEKQKGVGKYVSLDPGRCMGCVAVVWTMDDWSSAMDM